MRKTSAANGGIYAAAIAIAVIIIPVPSATETHNAIRKPGIAIRISVQRITMFS